MQLCEESVIENVSLAEIWKRGVWRNQAKICNEKRNGENQLWKRSSAKADEAQAWRDRNKRGKMKRVKH